MGLTLGTALRINMNETRIMYNAGKVECWLVQFGEPKWCLLSAPEEHKEKFLQLVKDIKAMTPEGLLNETTNSTQVYKPEGE